MANELTMEIIIILDSVRRRVFESDRHPDEPALPGGVRSEPGLHARYRAALSAATGAKANYREFLLYCTQ